MYTIYDLKNLLYRLILDKIKESIAIPNNECTLNIYNMENQYYKISINNDMSMYLSIQSVNVESIDGKNYSYKISFNLILYFSNDYFYSNEKTVYNILEKILNLLHSMEFYYCYNINNSNIVSKFPVEKLEELNNLYLTVEWVTNLNFSANWFV